MYVEFVVVGVPVSNQSQGANLQNWRGAVTTAAQAQWAQPVLNGYLKAVVINFYSTAMRRQLRTAGEAAGRATMPRQMLTDLYSAGIVSFQEFPRLEQAYRYGAMPGGQITPRGVEAHNWTARASTPPQASCLIALPILPASWAGQTAPSLARLLSVRAFPSAHPTQTRPAVSISKVATPVNKIARLVIGQNLLQDNVNTGRIRLTGKHSLQAACSWPHCPSIPGVRMGPCWLPAKNSS
jgi:hypothetical protein